MTITETSLSVFLAYARDAGNWSGTPLVGGSKEERGNLTQLKQAGFIKTFNDGADTWIDFTAAGRSLAAQHGINL